MKEELLHYVLDQVKRETGKNWVIKNDVNKNIATMNCSSSYKCIVCDRLHDSLGLFVTAKE